MAEQEHPFKPGDVVQLKSGGPKMTVAYLTDREFQNKQWRAACKWWSGSGYAEKTFSFEELVKVNE